MYCASAFGYICIKTKPTVSLNLLCNEYYGYVCLGHSFFLDNTAILITLQHIYFISPTVEQALCSANSKFLDREYENTVNLYM